MPPESRAVVVLTLGVLVLSQLLWAQEEDLEFSRIRELSRARNWAGVLQVGGQFLQRFPLSSSLADVGYLMIVARVEGGDFSGALSDIRRFERLHSDSPYVSQLGHWEGKSHLLSRNYAAAETALRKHIARDPSGGLTPQSWYFLAQALEAQQKLREAEPAYARALELSRESALSQQAVSGRARVLSRLGQNARARGILRDFLDQPGQATDSLRLQYARVLYDLGDREESLRSLQPLNQSRDSAVREQAGFLGFRILYESRRWQEAREAARALPASLRDEPSFRLNLAEVHRQLGDIQTARSLWQGVATTARGDLGQVAAFNLALSSQDPTETIEWLETARRGPEANLAREARWRLSFVGDPRKRIELLREIVRDPQESARHRDAYRRLLLLAQEAADRGLILQSLDGLVSLEEGVEQDRYLLMRARLRPESEYDLALRDLQAIVRKQPRSEYAPRALYEIGSIYSRRAEYVRAEGFFHQASQLATGELKELALLARGIAFYNAQNFEQAVAVLQRLRREHPQSRHLPQGMLLIARSQIKSNRVSEARPLLAQLVSTRSPFAAEAAYELGLLDSATDSRTALEHFLTAHRLAEERSEVRLDSLDAALTLMYRAGDVAAMGPYLRPELWNAHPQAQNRLRYWQALVLAATDLPAALQRARPLATAFPRIYLEMERLPTLSPSQRLSVLDVALAGSGSEEDLLPVHLRKIQLLATAAPDRLAEEVRRWLLRWGAQEGRWDQARVVARVAGDLRRYQDALESVAPTIRAEFLLLAARQHLETDPEGARAMVQRVLAERGTRNQKQEAQWVNGMILLRQGRTSDARALFQGLLREEPIPEIRADVLLGLGLTEAALGDIDRALTLLEQSSGLGPWESSARAAFEGFRLARDAGRSTEQGRFEATLRGFFPNSPWTRRLD